MPLHRSPVITNNSTIGLWKVEETFPELLDRAAMLGFVVEGLRDFKSELKKMQWVAARCLTRAMDPDINQIFYNDFGAPSTDTGTRISLSHSARMVAVILDKEEEVGIDIQHMSLKIKNIKTKFCSSEELKFVAGGQSLDKLHLIWAAKEAIYKKFRTPGLIFKEQIGIQPFEVNGKGILEAFVNQNESRTTLKLVYEILDDYTMVYTLNT